MSKEWKQATAAEIIEGIDRMKEQIWNDRKTITNISHDRIWIDGIE